MSITPLPAKNIPQIRRSHRAQPQTNWTRVPWKASLPAPPAQRPGEGGQTGERKMVTPVSVTVRPHPIPLPQEREKTPAGCRRSQDRRSIWLLCFLLFVVLCARVAIKLSSNEFGSGALALAT